MALCRTDMGYQCSTKSLIRLPTGHRHLVNCGVCLQCKIRRQQSWVLRMILEKRFQPYSSFLTLTYSPLHCPERIDKRDITLFLKKLRNYALGHVRYFYCGEYGEHTKRPHYHLILFSDQRLPFQTGLSSCPKWQQGFVFTGDVTPASMAYVARYSLKVTQKNHLQPIVGMSRMPGIGVKGIRQVASYLATQRKEIEYIPGLMKVGQRYLPLDTTMREHFEDAYTLAGGKILHEEVSAMQLHLRSDFQVLYEELDYEKVAYEIKQIAHKELERGEEKVRAFIPARYAPHSR